MTGPYGMYDQEFHIHEIFAGRPRDLEDARTILLKNPDLDTLSIRNRLKQFDECSEGKHFLMNVEDLIVSKHCHDLVS